jgi:uncharacterized membrane protein HdeD (DUF308 family)
MRTSRYWPLVLVTVGVTLIIFTLAVTSASRFVLVVGGVAIVSGVVRGITRYRDHSPPA